MDVRKFLIWQFLLAATAIGVSQSSFPLYPTFSLLVFLAVTPTVLVGIYSPLDTTERSVILLFGLVCFVVMSRFAVALRPASMIGYDPDKYAAFANITLEAGHIPELGFYGFAPLFHLLPTIVAIFSDGLTRHAFLVYIFVLGAAAPTLAWCFAHRVSGPNAATVAAGFGASLPLFRQFAVWPIAQALGTVFTVIAVYVLGRSLGANRYKNRWIGILLLSLLAGGLTHKLPLIVGSLILLSCIILQYIFRGRVSFKSHESDNVSRTLFVIVAVFGVAEYTLFTDFVRTAVALVQGLASVFSSETTMLPMPEAATQASAGVYTIFGSFSHALVLLPIMFVLWMLALRKWSLEGMRLVLLAGLGATLGMVGLIAPGFFSSVAPQPTRFYLFASVLIAAFVGVCTIETRTSTDQRALLAIGLIILIIFQSFALSASIAPPGQSRYYLTNEEVTGKQFVERHLEGPVYTDQYYAREIIFPEDVKSMEYPAARLGGSIATPPFKPVDGPLFNGTITQVETVAIRTDEVVFRPTAGTVGGGFQTLSYTPTKELSRTHSTVYSNGGVRVFWNFNR